MAIYACPIPKIPDAHKDLWDQPKHSEIQFSSDGFAVVTLEGMDQLKQYDTTLPSGVYAGKMWKREEGGTLYLCWYQDIPDQPGQCEIKFRKILPKAMLDLINPPQDHM